MNVARTLDFFETQMDKASQDLGKYLINPDVEVLHQIRVDLKKIRAVIIQIEKSTGNKKIKKTHRYIKHIFRKGGQIRELQLDLLWLKKHRKFNLIRHMKFDARLKKSGMAFHKEIPVMLHTLGVVRKKMERFNHGL